VPAVDRGGNVPNLGYAGKDPIQHLETIVFNGPFTARGMPDFTGKIMAEDVEKIKACIQGMADAVRPK
jgi:quinohemoprotein ethanol dehydrogenase